MTGKPEKTAKAEKPDKGPPRWVRLASGAGTAIIMTVAGSFLGAAGTIAGAAFGSVLSAVLADALTAGGTRLHHKAQGWGRRRLIIIAASAAAVFAATAGVITAAEAVAGKPVSAIVQDKHGSGTTFGGGTVQPQPSPSPEPSVSPATVPTVQVTPTPTPTPSYPLPTPTPTPSASSPTPTPAPSPSAPAPTPSSVLQGGKLDAP